jgi:hypothetical protein
VTLGGIARNASARKRVANIHPTGIESYKDCVKLWLQDPLTYEQLDDLKQECGYVEWRTWPKRWDRDRRYRQWLQLCQPSDEALRFIAAREHLLNYAEVALDLMFDDADDRDHAHWFINHHHVKKWHRDQEIKFVNGTRYTGKRSVPNKLVSYADRPSRTTGELFCLHIEWRINGVRALRGAGIDSANDLLTLSHREFWEDRLLLKAVNLPKLGRLYNRHVSGKGPKRGPWVQHYDNVFTYDYDRRTGGTLLQLLTVNEPEWVNADGQPPATEASTQRVIDHYRTRFNVNPCLDPLDVQHLLPTAQDTTLRFGDCAQSQWVTRLNSGLHHRSYTDGGVRSVDSGPAAQNGDARSTSQPRTMPPLQRLRPHTGHSHSHP